MIDGKKRTMDVPTAGAVYYNLSRDASYRAAQRGDIPTIRVGRLLRVPISLMERMLEETGRDKSDLKVKFIDGDTRDSAPATRSVPTTKQVA